MDFNYRTSNLIPVGSWIIPSMLDSPAIRDAIDGLYATFSTYELREFTDPCMHCHTLEDEAKVHAKPLRELTPEDLRQYSEDALLVWGDERDFRHFLPRICELFCRCDLYNGDTGDGYFLFSPHILFTKFRHGNWRTWPTNEREAVQRFLSAIWANFLGDPPDEDASPEPFPNAEDVVCSIAQCEDDLSRYLEEWIVDRRVSSAVALVRFIEVSEMCTHRVPVTESFWGQRGTQYLQIQNWLCSAEVEQKLLKAEQESEGTELAAKLKSARFACGAGAPGISE
ncbi:MAG TPA: hypothetical protein VKB38_11460 [Terracidiphilus sp.]|nr:hypothetical protein [Terracidiphilus sp.]